MSHKILNNKLIPNNEKSIENEVRKRIIQLGVSKTK